MLKAGKVADIYDVIGVMSGTSVDGLDIALCRFERVLENRSVSWKFRIIEAQTFSYTGTPWPERLNRAERLGGLELMELHRDFGKFTGETINTFLAKSARKPGLIASHGHTVFHQPKKGITMQIGDGAVIAAITGITTISDFRRLDVALGGQGAPLVPIGDELLFGRYGYCLNLGGFSNVSFRKDGKRLAFDICPVNIVLNRLARQSGKEYDKDGELALSGRIENGLLEMLEGLEYYRKPGPRSLGKEWVENFFMPLVNNYKTSEVNKLRTVCEHIALQISSLLNMNVLSLKSVLVTGGGVKNSFLMELISCKVSSVSFEIPGQDLIDFKEALVFGFLGVLRIRNEPNCISSVTGASRDNSGGIIHIAARQNLL